MRDNIDILEAGMRIAGISLSWLMKSASKTPARSRTTKVGPIVDQICDHAYQFGLPDAELLRLVELVTTGTELDQSNITTLIKSFYPTGKVSSTIVTRIVLQGRHQIGSTSGDVPS